MKKILLISVITVMLLFVFCFTASASVYIDFSEFNFCDGHFNYFSYLNNSNGFDSSVEDEFGVVTFVCSECGSFTYGFVNVEWWHTYLTGQNVDDEYDFKNAILNLVTIGAIKNESGLYFETYSTSALYYFVYEKYVAELNSSSYDDGVSDGVELGYTSGFSQGEAAGLKAGYEEGFADYKHSTGYLLELEKKYNEGYYDREAESLVSIDYSFITMAVPILLVLGAIVVILSIVKRRKR